METFRKGPWEIDHEENNQVIISAPDIEWAIASCYCDPVSEETRANARLIAAAPEMYGILKAIVEDENPPLAMIREKAGELLNKINQ
jgi:hypothetical protein